MSDKYTHYMESDGEIYSTAHGGHSFVAADRKVVFVLCEDELPEVMPNNHGLTVEGMTGIFSNTDTFGGARTYEEYVRAFIAILLFRKEQKAQLEQAAAREEAARVDAEAQRLADLFADIDPNPHGWYKPESHLIRELVKRGVKAPEEES